MSAVTQTLGVYVVGQKPEPLRYQFQDENGVGLTLTDYTACFIWRERFAGVAVTGSAALVDAGAAGWVQHTWTGAEFPTPGRFECEFWAGNETNRFASDLLLYEVRDAVGSIVPDV